MRKLMIGKFLTFGLAVGLAASLQAGNNYYVDANNGNDDWDGSAAEWAGGESTVGPKKTLMAACALLKANNSDKLYAAAGLYNEGVITNTTMNGINPKAYWRACLPKTASLIATGTKEETIIEGAKATISPEKSGMGTNAVRCVYVGAGSLLKGFTIRNGYALHGSPDNDAGCRGGGVVGENSSSSYVVDCVVSNCVAGSSRGSSAYYVCAIRSRMAGELNISKAYSCILNYANSYATLYNCTLGYGGGSSTFWNCASTADNGGTSTTYSWSAIRGKAASTTVKDGTFVTTTAAMNLDATSTPVAPSVLIDAGTNDYYSAVYPTDAIVAEWKDQDFYGNPRVRGGKIDIGAVEAPRYVTITAAQAGIAIEGGAVGANPIPDDEPLTIRIMRTTPLCTGLQVGEETVDFTTHEPGWQWEGTFSAADGNATVTALYTTLSKRDYYVDAVNGDDANTGYFPGKGFAKRTLMGGMKLAKSGDTVHAAAGTYEEGSGYTSTYGSNRVYVASGVLLVGDEGAAKTTIHGKKSDTTTGCGADSLRCVEIASGGVLKGFTLEHGFSPSGYSGNLAVGALIYGGLAVECVLNGDCMASNRGPIAQCNLLRCHITGTGYGNGSEIGYMGVVLLDCIWDANGNCYSSCSAYNTTFVKGYIYFNSSARNCLFLSGNYSAKHYSCISTSAKGLGTDEDGKCQFSVPAANLAYDPVTYRPLGGVATNAVDAGNSTYYADATKDWSTLWKSFLGTDYAGGARTLGAAIDVGAGEYNWREAAEIPGLTVEIGETTITFTRNFTSDKLTTGFTLDGEAYSFAEGESVVVAIDPTAQHLWSAVYAETQTDWYVDAVNGDDANKGYHAQCAVKTLAKAASIAKASGNIIHAAAGVYDEGVMAPKEGTTSNRVVLATGVGLVATEGPKKTVIVGKRSEQNASGLGTDAIRCVNMSSAAGAYVRGFTLTGGSTTVKAKEYDVPSGGGAVYYGTAVDCIITNNTCGYRGGAGTHASFVRCYIADNTSADSTGNNCNNSDLYGCFVRGGETCHYNEKIVGCTYVGCSPDANPNAYVYNSLIAVNNTWTTDAGLKTYNCVTPSAKGTGTDNGKSVFGATNVVLDADYRPVALNQAIDVGDLDYTNQYPAAWRDLAVQCDFAGGQRVYNAKMDAGVGEYDWRAAYGAFLNRRGGVTVTNATANVSNDGASKDVVVPAGEELAAKVVPTTTGEYRIYAAGAGTVEFDGTPLSLAGADYYAVQVVKGEEHVVRVVGGEGGITLKGFVDPKRAMILFVQ